MSHRVISEPVLVAEIRSLENLSHVVPRSVGGVGDRGEDPPVTSHLVLRQKHIFVSELEHVELG